MLPHPLMVQSVRNKRISKSTLWWTALSNRVLPDQRSTFPKGWRPQSRPCHRCWTVLSSLQAKWAWRRSWTPRLWWRATEKLPTSCTELHQNSSSCSQTTTESFELILFESNATKMNLWYEIHMWSRVHYILRCMRCGYSRSRAKLPSSDLNWIKDEPMCCKVWRITVSFTIILHELFIVDWLNLKMVFKYLYILRLNWRFELNIL